VAVDHQVEANHYVMGFEHPAYGQYRVCASPIQFDHQWPEVRRPAADVGAHTEEVLLELGYSWEDIGRMKEEAAVS
jgi:crotonobetainyl-CoA:carnitine CoA-transferase CaiB-like acyl-CoA transferase